MPGNIKSVARHGARFLTCCSITANAICAGGIFTFPLLSTPLASSLKLTQPQLTTIVLAGIMGQYPFAFIVGKIIDNYGPWASSLISCLLFSYGFGSFSREVATASTAYSTASSSTFHHLTIYFFLTGLATVCSYFSSLFAASKNFPNHIGFASGVSMAIFGLSPLFLSLIASEFFTDKDTGLDVPSFLRCLAMLSGGVHLLGAFTLRIPPLVVDSQTPTGDNLQGDSDSDERTALLPREPVLKGPQDGTTLDLMRDPAFWVLWAIGFITFGICEMIMSNMGTIVSSLPQSSPSLMPLSVPPTEAATATQVRLLSLANTLSRLLTGPISDFVSPTGTVVLSRKHRVSRIVFLTASSALLALTLVWADVGIRSQEGVWALSIGVGIVYGSAFTVLPSIISSIWGLSNLGRNFGLLTYAPFIGTPTFSYLYAFVSASHVQDGENVCKGVRCWENTFRLCATMASAACIASIVLWRTWSGRL